MSLADKGSPDSMFSKHLELMTYFFVSKESLNFTPNYDNINVWHSESIALVVPSPSMLALAKLVCMYI